MILGKIHILQNSNEYTKILVKLSYGQLCNSKVSGLGKF